MPNKKGGEKELRGRARCAEGERMKEWADKMEEEWGGGKEMNRAREKGRDRQIEREQSRAERPGEEEKSRTGRDRCICA